MSLPNCEPEKLRHYAPELQRPWRFRLLTACASSCSIGPPMTKINYLNLKIECVLCLRRDRMKYGISTPIQKFFSLHDPYVRGSDDWVRLKDIVQSSAGTVRWLCQWCHNATESWYLGGNKRWVTPYGSSKNPEWIELFCLATLANRLRIEARKICT